MADLRLSIAFGDYPYTRPLASGRVAPRGIELDVRVQDPTLTLFGMLRDREFDAGELSLGAHVTLTARGGSPFVAIPVFMHKSYRHDGIYVRPDAGIRDPADLRGKRVGVVQYGGTAVIWMRGVLQHDFGVGPADIAWFMGGQSSAASPNMTALDLPPEIHLEYVPEGKTLEGMIEAGELDALFCMTTPNLFLDGSGRLNRLFPDVAAAEADYNARTGIHPIAHTLAVKREVYEANPWIAGSLFRAFIESRELALEEPDEASAIDAEARRQSKDEYWAYGVEPNRASIEAMCRFVMEQGLTSRVVNPEELFVQVDA